MNNILSICKKPFSYISGDIKKLWNLIFTGSFLNILTNILSFSLIFISLVTLVVSIALITFSDKEFLPRNDIEYLHIKRIDKNHDLVCFKDVLYIFTDSSSEKIVDKDFKPLTCDQVK